MYGDSERLIQLIFSCNRQQAAIESAENVSLQGAAICKNVRKATVIALLCANSKRIGSRLLPTVIDDQPIRNLHWSLVGEETWTSMNPTRVRVPRIEILTLCISTS